MRVRDVVGALAGAAFLIGAPLLLARAGWPLTGNGIGAAEAVMFLRGGAVPAPLLSAVLVAAVWAAWSVFVLAVLADLARLLRGVGPRMAGLRLLAALLAGSGTAAAAAPAWADSVAEAPASPGADDQGEAESAEAGGVQRNRVLAGFGTDSAELDAAMRESIESTAGLVATHSGTGARVTITGHTDPTGPDQHNQQLSQQRARAAADHLRRALGEDAPGVEITTRGHGAEQARADDSTSHADLRRIEVTYRLQPTPSEERPAAPAGAVVDGSVDHAAASAPGRSGEDERLGAAGGLPVLPVAAAFAAAGAGYLLGRRSGRRTAETPLTATEETSTSNTASTAPSATTLSTQPAVPYPPAPAPGIGVEDLLAGASAGLSVTGPAAPRAIAALLGHAAQHGAPVIATTTALPHLDSTPPGVQQVSGIDAALIRTEAHLLAAHRGAAHGDQPVVFIEAPPPGEGADQLAELLNADRPEGARVIAAGDLETGWKLEATDTTLRLHRPDGSLHEADADVLITPPGSLGTEEAAHETPPGHPGASDRAPEGPDAPVEHGAVQPVDDSGDSAEAPVPDSLPPAASVRLRLFAPRIIVEAAGTDISARMRGSARTLLALLALRPHGVSADETAEILAPGAAAVRARSARNNAASSARRTIRDAIGDDHATVIETDNGRLRLSGSIEVDLWDWERACRAARKTSDTGRSRRLGTEARRLYQADLLADISEPWIEPERERCRREAAHLFTDLARHTDEIDEKIEWLSQACAVDRHNESLHRALMETQNEAGRPDDANRTYRGFVENLADIGERPSKRLREAAAEISARSPTLNRE